MSGDPVEGIFQEALSGDTGEVVEDYPKGTNRRSTVIYT
jgi:hypothetical protein